MINLSAIKSKFKKILFFSGITILSLATFSAIACKSINEDNVKLTPEDRRLKAEGQGTDIREKTLENEKTVVQLKMAGYNQFTFSDYWWLESDNQQINVISEVYGIDAEKSLMSKRSERIIKQLESGKIQELPSVISREVFFKVDNLKAIEEEIGKTSMLETSKSLDDQTNSDKQFKTISLVSDEESLKTQLRVSEQEKEKFSQFIKEKVDSNLTEEQIEKLKPWNSYVTFDLIKDKLNLENNNYLFIKDLTRFIENADSYYAEKYKAYVKVDTGVQLSDYKINKETKTITLKFSYVTVPDSFFVTKTLDIKPYVYTGPRKSTSWLVPVDKNELSDFDLNEWTIKIASRTSRD
ncbi:hypothetical protein CJJ23_00385 [Mycoplasmopsis agassizii]|uniref:Lipoprotein n=1 Tax=Mycoplasmopsis agassizii TaxID=33922 RepID=A0A269TK09_9BACT|nr:hypothetical protein [Mycoplasmopsis agassizii]PAK21789.1 hypothetical protein CJJ23_00385 [Mycoplasmopsis agassizii]